MSEMKFFNNPGWNEEKNNVKNPEEISLLLKW